jgi:methyl-accepting chemotaxis protein
MKINDIRVSHKLWATILGLLLIMLGVTTFTQQRAGLAMENALADVLRYEARITEAVRWQGMIEANTERSLAAIASTDAKTETFFHDRISAGSERISALQAHIKETATSEADKHALEQIGDARKILLAALAKVPQVKASGDPEAGRNFAQTEFMPKSDAYNDALKAFVKVQEGQRDAAKVEALRARSRATLLGMVGAAVVVVIGIVLALVLVRTITQPLARVVATAQAISAGDLTQTLDDDRKDEFGHLLNALSHMVTRLRGLVSEVRVSTETIATASKEISAGNLDLSARTEAQASSLEETASAMEQLTGTVKQNADNAQQANQLVLTASEVAVQGGQVVERVVGTMNEIKDSSRKIVDIISVIDGIAFQTNILALNAAVEAARAGEQGRGFAVVATEVRNLAQRSAGAAKEIKTLINDSVGKVDVGSKLVDEAGATMEHIVTSVKQVTDIMSEITAASREQSTGIEEISRAITQMDEATQQNAALVEEAAAAAGSLQEQAGNLMEQVSVFKVSHDAPGAIKVKAAKSQPTALPAPRLRPAIASGKRPDAARLAPALPKTHSAENEWEEF